MRTKSRGFTLVELMIVIAIVGILAAIVGGIYFGRVGFNMIEWAYPVQVVNTPAPGCVPGQVVSCPLPGTGAMTGTQTCSKDGKSFGPCMGLEVPPAGTGQQPPM